MGSMLFFAASLLFVALVLIWMSLMAYVDQRRRMAHRLSSPSMEGMASEPLRVTMDDGFLERFDRLVSPSNEKERAAVRLFLTRAGYRAPSAIRIYYMSKAAFAVVFAIVTATLLVRMQYALPYVAVVAAVLVAALAGFGLPYLWVERLVERRHEEAERSFPDTLDMLLVCVEAGLGVDQACRRVAAQMAVSSPVLAEELGVVNNELSAGKERAAVFRDFSERTGVEDIRAFTTILRQSDEYGVSIADTLRVYASEMRHKRIMRAEEKANLMPIKIALGSILFTIPPTMIILSGPSVIMLLRAFGVLK